MSLSLSRFLKWGHNTLSPSHHHRAIATQPASKPVIILVSGAWHLPDAWHKVKPRLEAAGYEVYTPRLLTVVGSEPVDYSWRVDVAVVHDIVLPLFEQGREVVIVGHSYGGVVATAAVKGQSVLDRQAQGLRGGFCAVVYICAFAFPQRGSSVFLALGGEYPGWMTSAEPLKNIPFSMTVMPDHQQFYTDLPDDEAAQWCGKLQYHSQRSFEEPLDYSVNDIKIPTRFLLCEGDKAMPIQMQEKMAEAIPGMKTRRCTAGHSPFLSQPDTTAEVIIEAACSRYGG